MTVRDMGRGVTDSNPTRGQRNCQFGSEANKFPFSVTSMKSLDNFNTVPCYYWEINYDYHVVLYWVSNKYLTHRYKGLSSRHIKITTEQFTMIKYLKESIMCT